MIAKPLAAALAALLALPVAAQEPTPIRVWREAEPEVGRRVTVATPEGTRRLWEMTQAVEVRARTLSGAALTDPERAGVRALALACPVGEGRALSAGVEDPSGTYVVRFECAWLRSPPGP